jgi:hypothetical protein
MSLATFEELEAVQRKQREDAANPVLVAQKCLEEKDNACNEAHAQLAAAQEIYTLASKAVDEARDALAAAEKAAEPVVEPVAEESSVVDEESSEDEDEESSEDEDAAGEEDPAPTSEPNPVKPQRRTRHGV